MQKIDLFKQIEDWKLKPPEESCFYIDLIRTEQKEELEKVRAINVELREQSRYWYLKCKELANLYQQSEISLNKEIGDKDREIQSLKDKVREAWTTLFTIY